MVSKFLSQVGAPNSPVPTLEFAAAGWLVLVPLLCFAAWWIARRALGGWHGGRQTVGLVVRCLVILIVCGALAQPSIRWTSKDVALVVVRDVSRSVPADQQQLAESFIDASVQLKRAADRIGVVDAAGSASVRTMPSTVGPSGEVSAVSDVAATDLQSALRLAKGLVPSDAAGRILLISDGNQTTGSLREAADELVGAGVPLDIAAVEYDRTQGIRVQSIHTPAWTRPGAHVDARIVIESGRECVGRLDIVINQAMVDLNGDTPGTSTEIALNRGLNVFTLPLKLTDAPSHSIEVILEPVLDEFGSQSVTIADTPELLRAQSLSFTSSQGRVLLVAEMPLEYVPLLTAIRSDEVTVDTVSAAALPHTLPELAGYDAIILGNQPVTNIPLHAQEALVQYVHDAGGGLVMLGGPESFGAGGWIGSRLADALPIALDPPQKRQMPMGALALVIDQSGSMCQTVAGTGQTQQALANESAILGIRALSRLDEIAVVAFSGGHEVVVPLTRAQEMESIARRIRGIGSGGGTVLFPAITAAAKELEKSRAGTKHIIILTDGQTSGDPAEGYGIAAELSRRGITISTVAIGDGSNDQLLEQIARIGKGRSYGVNSKNTLAVLPQIFIKEAMTVRRSLIWEGPGFSPAVASFSESFKAIPTPLPRITGYIVAADRGGLSTVLLRGHENDPILAQWQHGLGKVVTYTSDATTRWNAGWTQWPSFDALWQQQLAWAMRPPSDPNARATVEMRGDRARLTVELADDNGEPVNFASVRGRVSRPAGAAGAPADVLLRQVGPGRYETEFDADEAGAHIAWLRYEATVRDAESGASSPRRGTLRAAAIRRSGDELREPRPDSRLLMQVAERTGGRIYRLDGAGADLWPREGLTMPHIRRGIWLLVALAAIGLFLADVAVRRIAIDPARVHAWMLGLVAAAPAATGASVAALAKAKSRPQPTEAEVMWKVSVHEQPHHADAPPTIPQPLAQPPAAQRDAAGSRHASAEDGDRMARLRAAKQRRGNE